MGAYRVRILPVVNSAIDDLNTPLAGHDHHHLRKVERLSTGGRRGVVYLEHDAGRRWVTAGRVEEVRTAPKLLGSSRPAEWH